MLHILSTPAPEPKRQPYSEAVSRLASVRHALRLVDGSGGGPASDFEHDAVVAAWDDAGEARRRFFDRKSTQLVGSTAAGVEALLIEREERREPNVEASRELVEQIRRELAEVARVILD